jgi:Protease subunit of ATP-dependent Clp proteases
MNLDKIRDDLLLLDKPELLIINEIDADEYYYVAKSLEFLITRNSPNLIIKIDSCGGKVRASLNIYDAIRLYRGKKIGIVAANAASMAAVILQACDQRCCTEHGHILIHHINLSIDLCHLQNEVKCDQIIKEMELEQESIFKIFIAKTGKNRSVIKKECAKNTAMSAEEALRFGLIDKII